MTSREDFGRLAYAAYCDMAGRPYAWQTLDGKDQAGWIHAAVTIRDRLMYGDGHGYRPDDRPQVEESTVGLVNKTTLHGGNEPPTITGTDDAGLYLAEKARGNTGIRWDGDGPAPDAEPEIEETPAEPESEPVVRPSRSARSKR